MTDEVASSERAKSLSTRVADWAGGAFFTLLASLAFFYFTSETPRLTYEVFPASSYVSEQTERTIYTVRIRNQGDAEAEDVRAVFDFPQGARVKDSKVNASSNAITYTLADTSASAREYTFPLLNPGESAKFSFLLSGTPRGMSVDVRGRGIVGVEEEGRQKGFMEKYGWYLYLATVAALLVIIFMLGSMLAEGVYENFEMKVVEGDEEDLIIDEDEQSVHIMRVPREEDREMY
jgi:hypothetical protein